MTNKELEDKKEDHKDKQTMYALTTERRREYRLVVESIIKYAAYLYAVYIFFHGFQDLSKENLSGLTELLKETKLLTFFSGLGNIILGGSLYICRKYGKKKNKRLGEKTLLIEKNDKDRTSSGLNDFGESE